jgi:phage tail sheath protein FI
VANDLASGVYVEEEDAVVRSVETAAATVVGFCGVTERGPVGRSIFVTSFPEFQQYCGSYAANTLDQVAAMKGFFDNGGTFARFTRVVHCTSPGDPTTKTSAAGSVALQTASVYPTAGYTESGVQPFALEHGQTLTPNIDAAGVETLTLAAVAGYFETTSAGPYALVNTQTWILSGNGVAVPSKVFSTGEFAAIGAATTAELVGIMNAWFLTYNARLLASNAAGKLRVTSTRKGTSAAVTVTGGTATALAGASTAGSGDAAFIDATTAAELSAFIAATGATNSVSGGRVRVTSDTTGDTSSVQFTSAGTATGAGFDAVIHTGSDGTAVDRVKFWGRDDGAWANEVTVVASTATNGDAASRNLNFLRNGISVERRSNVSFDPASTAYFELVFNSLTTGSVLFRAEDLLDTSSLPPAAATYGPMTGGNDGLSGIVDADYVGEKTEAGATGLRVFDSEGDDVSVVVMPGRATSAAQNGMLTFCETYKRGLCFAILDPPADQTALAMKTYVETTAALVGVSDKGAIYWPRVKVANPSVPLYGSGATVTVPPSGHVAGVYARVAQAKVGGQFSQPAGTEVGILRGVLGLETEEVRDHAKRELVFPSRINPISRETGTGFFIDGARNLKASSPWPSVGQRIGVTYVERALVPGLAFARHQNINTKLHKRVERTTSLFLTTLTRAECFASPDPALAFFTDVSPSLNPPSVQAQGKVYNRIGLATSKPAEFIILVVGPDTRALDAELAASGGN